MNIEPLNQTNFGPPSSSVRSRTGIDVPVATMQNFETVRKKLLIVLQFYAGDVTDMASLAELIADLERIQNTDADILVFARADAPPFPINAMNALQAKFNRVHEMRCRRQDASGFPYGPNEMWHDLVGIVCSSSIGNSGQRFADFYWGFLNLEADCCPTGPGWIRRICDAAREAFNGGALAIGHIQEQLSPGGPRRHMNGVAVYSSELNKRVPANKLLGCPPDAAFDIAHAPELLPYCVDTPTIFLDYRLPTISEDGLFAPRKLGAVPSLFHGVRDRSARAHVRNRFLEGGATQAVSGKTIFTYFDPVPEMQNNGHAEQIQLWKDGWSSRGWNPVVLDRYSAMRHPLYHQFLAKVKGFPSVNPTAYEQACWCRWLALRAMGGGLMGDYDVLPGAFRPRDLPKAKGFIVLGRTVPSLVLATEKGLDAFIAAIMAYDPATALHQEDGRNHLSDMIFVQELLTAKAPFITSADFQREVGEPGWPTARTVHFAACPMRAAFPGKTKQEIMRRYLGGQLA